MAANRTHLSYFTNQFARLLKTVLPIFNKNSTLELVKLLTHPNRWWRLQAQRLILERQDISVVPTLNTLFDQSEDPKVRLHALYALEGLNSLTDEFVKKALNDTSPGIREHGIILSERFPDCLEQALLKIDDPSIRVAFQATLTTGDFHGEKVVTALAHALTKYGTGYLVSNCCIEFGGWIIPRAAETSDHSEIF